MTDRSNLVVPRHTKAKRMHTSTHKILSKCRKHHIYTSTNKPIHLAHQDDCVDERLNLSVYIYACMHACMHVCMYVHPYINICVHMYICIHAYM